MGIRIGDHLEKNHKLSVLEKHIETEEKVKRGDLVSELAKIKCKSCGHKNKIYKNIQSPIKDYGNCQKCGEEL